MILTLMINQIAASTPFFFCINSFGSFIPIIADAGVVSVAYELLLSAVVLMGMMGVGWAAKRLLGRDGIIESLNKSLAANAISVESVAQCVKQHDSRAAQSMSSHADTCSETQKTVRQVHSAAIIACDVVEQECKKRDIDVSSEINRIRNELVRQN